MSKARSPRGLVSMTMGIMLWGAKSPLFWGVSGIELSPCAVPCLCPTGEGEAMEGSLAFLFRFLGGENLVDPAVIQGGLGS